MPGSTDLAALIAGMEPILQPGRFVFATTGDRIAARRVEALMRFEETEGTTLILSPQAAAAAGLTATFPCRMITLNVTSALEAVGFVAAVARALTAAGIGANPVSGFHHDHLFIAEDQADAAMAALELLARSGQNDVSARP